MTIFKKPTSMLIATPLVLNIDWMSIEGLRCTFCAAFPPPGWFDFVFFIKFHTVEFYHQK